MITNELTTVLISLGINYTWCLLITGVFISLAGNEYEGFFSATGVFVSVGHACCGFESEGFFSSTVALLVEGHDCCFFVVVVCFFFGGWGLFVNTMWF